LKCHSIVEWFVFAQQSGGIPLRFLVISFVSFYAVILFPFFSGNENPVFACDATVIFQLFSISSVTPLLARVVLK
jgi:hypothetical protein